MPNAPRPPLAPRARLVFWSVLVAGLALRLLWLGRVGTGDMEGALDFGRAVLSRGLADGYTGGNFPVAFQEYTGVVWVSRHTGLGGIATMRLFLLVLDTATLALVCVALRQLRLDVRWALLYWVGPFSLAIWALGYDHMTMGVLVMATVVLLLRARRPRDHVLAAIPFALGFLQRPQFEGMVVMLVLYLGLVTLEDVRRHRRLRPLDVLRESGPVVPLLAGCVGLFGAYSLYFWAHFPSSPLYLAHSYKDVELFSLGLNGNMLNLWGAVAELYRTPDQAIPAVVQPDVYNSIAGVLTAALFIAAAVLIFRGRSRRPIVLDVILLFAAASIIAPNAYTHAHDPHFYLGALLGILLVPMARDRVLTVTWNASLTLQAINMYGLYALGQNSLSRSDAVLWLPRHWTYDLRFWLDLVNTVLFLVIIWRFGRWVRRESADAEATVRDAEPTPATRTPPAAIPA